MKKKKQKKIDPPQIQAMTGEWYSEASPMELFLHIDYNFTVMNNYLKRAGRARADLREVLVRWGVWSRKMNTIIRARINREMPIEMLMASKDPKVEEQKMKDLKAWQHRVMQEKLAYGYWWNRTHFLEMYRRSWLGRVNDRKNINAGMASIKKMIMENVSPEDIKKHAPDFYNLMDRLSKKKELTAEETESVLNGGPGPVNEIDK